ncbi:MAG: F0F1 ATP synthase subunit C, partial [Candidatus Sulfotelmatobacter sp.]
GVHICGPGYGVHCRRDRRQTARLTDLKPKDAAMNWLAFVSIISAAVAVSFGAIGPAFAEGRAVAAAMDAIARQPEAANTISRTLFVGLAMIETMAIYCLVIALLLLFANPLLK